MTAFASIAEAAGQASKDPWLKTYGPILVSLLALVFSITSFWWNTGRRGRLLVSQPRTFAAHLNAHDRRLMLLMPLAMRNTGALPLVIKAMRLRMLPENGRVMHFVRTRSQVNPSSGEVNFATNLVIGGREARVLICEFEATMAPNWEPVKPVMPFKLEILFDHKENWAPLTNLSVWADDDCWQLIRERYVAHDNIKVFSE